MASIGMVFLPMISHAQASINIPYALSNELGVKTTPSYPRDNEIVSINLTLYTDDLDSANITWYKDNKIVLNGKGETKYSFRTGPVGTETKIEIKIDLLSGYSFSKSFTIKPAGVGLVWEADSYVPPFYKGKALHPMQGTLKIVAMPELIRNGKRISSENLVYKWSNNVESYQNQSGYGKSVLILNGSILGKSDVIQVMVTDPISNLTAQGFIRVSPIDPQIVFYQNDPYYGYIFDSAVTGTFNLKGGEIQILAAPYYFTKEGSYGLTYAWRLNNQAIPDLSGSRTAIFKKPEGETGQSNITLQVTNANRILQEASNGLTMQFKK